MTTAQNPIPRHRRSLRAMTRPVPPQGDTRPYAPLSGPMRNALAELARGRTRHGEDWRGGHGWGSTLHALERRGLVECRWSPLHAGWTARIRTPGLDALDRLGIPWR
jgi:hypothetical protein